MNRCILRNDLAAAGLVLTATSVHAGSHLWKFSEVFSNADGTIQFVEMKCPAGANAETGLGGKSIFADQAGNSFTFPSNIQGPTGNKHILLGTKAFAALPGAPDVDYIIEDGFFNLDGETLRWHVYSAATWNIADGAIPTDCVNSLALNGTVTINSPTNYSGDSGEVDCNPVCDGDLSDDGMVDGADLGLLLGAWGSGDEDADLNGDGVVDGADLGLLLGAWGPC